jgi:pyruvate dehydrogenase E2 component (dihydrolipoamide acetyltransferase)
MATPIAMPRQGQSVEVCTINEWLVNEGDTVNEGDVLFSYETDKATFEYESPAEGTLLARFFEADAEVPVLTTVAVIGEQGEDVSPFRPDAQTDTTGSGSVAPPEKEAAPAQEDVRTSHEDNGEMAAPAQRTSAASVHPKAADHGGPDATAGTDRAGRVSPRARKKAEEMGIIIDESLQGSGPGGRIIERDLVHMTPATRTAQEKARQEGLTAPAQGSGIGGRVTSEDLAAATAAPAAAQQGAQAGDADEDASEVVKMSSMRKIIAERMHSSLQETAQLTMHAHADARQLLAFRARIKEHGEALGIGKISVTDIISYAVTRVLLRHRGLNAVYQNDEYRQYAHVHLAMAVDTPRGLMVPVVRSADRLSLRVLSQELKSRVEQCKQGSIDPDLLSGGTITISNLGTFGIESFTPILNAPQVALLGINSITPRPTADGNGGYEIVPHIGFSLTIDHRVVDGAPAARFLKDVVMTIEHITLSFCL